MADGEQGDNWMLVDTPQDKQEEPAAQPDKAPVETEQNPEAEKAPSPEPEAEKPAEPEPETPAEPEPETPAEPEPEPETPVDPETEAPVEQEPEVPAEPEPEETPAEPTTESEQQAESEPAAEETVAPVEEPVRETEEQQPADEAPSESQDEPAPEPTAAEAEPQPKEETPVDGEETKSDTKPEEEASGEAAEDNTVEVVIEVGTADTREEVTKTPEPGADISFGSYLRLCQVGSDMIKVKKSKGFPRNYRLDNDLLAIVWDSRKKPASRARIAIASIKEVRAGRSTDSFKISKDTHSEELCFSIIYTIGSTYKTLDLAAVTVADRTAWYEGLTLLLKQSEAGSGASRSKVRERWLKDLFDNADKDNSGTLDIKEVLRMMRELNVGVSTKVLKKKFKEADTEGASGGGDLDGKLNFDEFCSLFKELAFRPELSLLFNKYSSKMEWLTVRDLQKFLQLEQGAPNPSIEFCTQLVQKYEPTDEGKAQGWMSLDGFTQFMLGSENDIINIDRASTVYQDMRQPLSHYYIASSHNTYLLEDQLKGPSSCEAYIRALRKGCRCVELDCWDGPDGEPIIYHGHTFTSKILFKDAIEAIKEHAFAVSLYPVILSIENHCSIPQQHRMAEIMKSVLGDLLFDDARNDDLECLPSPEDLKRKILVKGKKLSKSLEEQDDDDGEVTDEDEAEEIDSAQLKKEQPTSKPAEPAAESKPEDKSADTQASGEDKPAEDKPAAEGESKPAEGAEAAPKASESPRKQRSMSFRQRQRKESEPPKPKKKIKLSAKLSKCVNYVQSVHFPGIEGYDGVVKSKNKCYHMSSFGESTALKLSRDQAARYVTYNKIQVSRTYPKGSRVDSSNYDPTPMWNTGCQIVALNYQTPGRAMDLNEGKFRDNGGCGYLLKPSVMRETLSRFNHNQKNVTISGFISKIVTIKVISGQQLPKPGDKQGEIIDPYVVLYLAGSDSDTQRHKTKTVNDNGFNPVWNETFTMSMKHPELAVLRIKVMDEDWGPNKDDFIGSYSLPINCLVPGYRHIHLTKAGNKLETGSIFVHVQIQDHVAPGRAIGRSRSGLTLKKNREYPEHHQVGHQGIDIHFREVAGPLRRATDIRENYTFSLLHFKDLVGHGPQAGVADCVELLIARATNAGVKITIEKTGDEETAVYKVGSVEGVVPTSLASMIESFTHLNQAIHAVLTLAPGIINELEAAHKEAAQQENALREHLTEGPNPHKKPEMVMDHFARTMFSIKSEAEQLKKVREDASESLKQLSEASQL